MADLLHPDKAFAELIDAGEITEADLLDIGYFAQNLVVLRTKQGVDVDGKPFEAYSEAYAKERQARGLSAKPDLAVTGHMLGSFAPEVTGPDEVSVRFMNPLEARIAAAHDQGFEGNVSVKAHTRSVYVNSKTGQRVSRAEASKDKRRKNKTVGERQEVVTAYTRHQKTKKREFADIRMPAELDALGEAVGEKIMQYVEKHLK